MSGGVPAGWMLVPVEMTPKMFHAMENAFEREVDRGQSWQLKYAYDAALSATPTPPIEGRDADVERVLNDAADFLRQYADFIRTEVKADDFERHPYLPSIDDTASALQALGERPHAD